MATGGCLCGAVRFRVNGKMGPIVDCHCGMCQRWHGNFGAYTNVRKTDLAIERDMGLAWFNSSGFARRGFCRECGSSLLWERLEGDRTSIAAGALDGPTGLRTKLHIFVADKPDWYEIADGLEQHPGSVAS